jgi:hypothetical protein
MRHPNKHIQAAIEYAEEHGWTVVRQCHHAFCVLRCPAGHRGGCQYSVWSTPRNPEAHAKDIRREVDQCEHCKDE